MNKIISYESSKWYIKLWRQRWYIYAGLIYIKNFINIGLWIDFILNQEIDEEDKKILKKDWNDFKRHIELSKMYKFSAKNNYEREE
jgi:hypothetical protein